MPIGMDNAHRLQHAGAAAKARAARSRESESGSGSGCAPLLDGDDGCTLHGSVTGTAPATSIFAQIERACNAPRPSGSGTAPCAQCVADFQARCDLAVPLPLPLPLPGDPDAPATQFRFVRRKRFWLALGLIFGSTAGALAITRSQRLSATTAVTTGNLTGLWPPPPLPDWQQPNTTTLSLTRGAARRREIFERNRVEPPKPGAHQLPAAPSTTTEPTPPDDIKIEKLHFPCIDERAHLSAASVLRQIGRTLQSPLSTMALESQVVYFHYRLGRCPTPLEEARCGQIFGAVDAVIGQLVSLLPAAKASVLLQNFVGPLLQTIADDLDGLAVAPELANIATSNYAFLARSAIAATPRDASGQVIVEELACPKNTRFGTAGPTTNLDGETWRLSFRTGQFIATAPDGRTMPVEYVRDTGRWEKRATDSDAEAPAAPAQALTREQLDARILDRLHVARKRPQPVPPGEIDFAYRVPPKPVHVNTLLAPVGDWYVPIRVMRDGVSYEAYDVDHPLETGYPVRVDEHDGFQFGAPVGFLARGSQTPAQSLGGLSKQLHDAIPRYWLVSGIASAHLSSPDSRGIMHSGDGQHYLQFDEGVVRIERHPQHGKLFQIGPPTRTQVMCAYDEDSERFLLVPEEFSLTPITRSEAAPVERLNGLIQQQERMAVRFGAQMTKLIYRDGYRTSNPKAFPDIVFVDSQIENQGVSVILYGLDPHELSLAGKYGTAARELKGLAFESARRVQELDVALHDPVRSERLLQRFLGLIHAEPNPQQRRLIRNLLASQLRASDRLLARHIEDDCRRIWLVDVKDTDFYGFVNVRDPLQRIFVNVRASSAYREQNVECAPLCAQRPANTDDLMTLLHEASHLAAGTQDLFYVGSPQEGESLAATVARLGRGEMSVPEAKYLLGLAGVKDPTGPDLDLVTAAARKFNSRPDLRARLFMDNADSFAQIVLELTDRDAHKRMERSTGPETRIMLALIGASVVQTRGGGATLANN